MENYFEDVCKVLDKLTDNRKKTFKMNFKSMLYFSTLMNRYRQDIIAKSPPDLLVKLLGFIGKIKGINFI
ncbi:MAG: cupin protein [Mucilaginibacter sp.]|nr:cupin protein [Mucilaginibacter sp.]